MEERDIEKKLDVLAKKVREAATDTKDLFVNMEYSANAWNAHGLSRLYITVTVSGFGGANRRHYAAGYIDLTTGKYSSKVSPREKYPSISLSRPTEKQIDMIVEGLGRTPKRAKTDPKLEHEWNVNWKVIEMQQDEDKAAEKEKREAREAIHYLDDDGNDMFTFVPAIPEKYSHLCAMFAGSEGELFLSNKEHIYRNTMRSYLDRAVELGIVSDYEYIKPIGSYEFRALVHLTQKQEDWILTFRNSNAFERHIMLYEAAKKATKEEE